MDSFHYEDGDLLCEELSVKALADEFGTPLYVYSRATLLDHFHKVRKAFAPANPHISYSVKANANLSILRLLREAGSGFDAVSGGEIYRILQAGGRGRDIVFAGVGKTEAEIAYALDADILMFNVESGGELERINLVAGRKGKTAPVSLRLNPDVDPKTHRYITTGKRENKFGLDLAAARSLLGRLGELPHVDFQGFHMHIGSQITQVDPYVEALTKLLAFVDEVRAGGQAVGWVNIGGGYGIYYTGDETAPPIETYAEKLLPLLEGRDLRLGLEPGRFVVGNAGLLVTEVLYVKPSGDKVFFIVDAAMNDLIRPGLYEAYHRIDRVRKEDDCGETVAADVVGPICESSDFLGKARSLPCVTPGEYLAVFSAGAYGFAMASNYNGRRRPAEVLVEGGTSRLIRARETYEDLVRLETAALG